MARFIVLIPLAPMAAFAAAQIRDAFPEGPLMFHATLTRRKTVEVEQPPRVKLCECKSPWLDRERGLLPHCLRCGYDRKKPL